MSRSAEQYVVHPPHSADDLVGREDRHEDVQDPETDEEVVKVTDFGLCNNFMEDRLMETYCGSMVYVTLAAGCMQTGIIRCASASAEVPE